LDRSLKFVCHCEHVARPCLMRNMLAMTDEINFYIL